MNEWISVNERLPELGPVLVCFLEPFFGSFSKVLEVGYYEESDNEWFFWLSGTKIVGGGVTHWMPLPEAPTL